MHHGSALFYNDLGMIRITPLAALAGVNSGGGGALSFSTVTLATSLGSIGLGGSLVNASHQDNDSVRWG